MAKENVGVTENEQVPFPEEIEHLKQINQMVDEELKEAQKAVDHVDEEYKEMLEYMSEHRGDIDPREMFQSEMALRQIDYSGASAVIFRDKLKKTKQSPYFARIDFQPNTEPEASKYYIGRFSFYYQRKLTIVDWRAPLAGMFYDYEIGEAMYDAPREHIEGRLTRKRQFSIKDSVMEYALESSSNIQDDVLQKELAHTSDEKMKSIIATIQKEQNQVIRDDDAKTLIIQGAAGSGKTSIALHRVAFLMYRLKDRLKAQNVTIISPNKVFGNYISNVLPELGEEPVIEASFVDVADLQLEEEIVYEQDKDPIEVQDKGWEARTRFKSSLEFVGLMDDYIEQLADFNFEAVDYVYEDFTIPAEWIAGRVAVYERFPLMKRLELIADDLYERLDTMNSRDDPLPKRRQILTVLKRMLKYRKTLQLYKHFYRQLGMAKMLKMPEKNTLEWNDVFPFLYLQAAFSGLQESLLIKHLVIDEMQDYTPIQYAVINRLFKCPKTILGDFGQSINPNKQHNLSDLVEMFEGAKLVRLEKSYRSTYEIIEFAKKIAQLSDFEAVERHGDVPDVIACKSEDEELEKIALSVEASLKEGFNNIGIITKTNSEAESLHARLLAKGVETTMISPESESFVNGVSVTSIQMSKGLEFDAVILPFVDDGHYSSEFDRNLLYVACTRAMHKLTILHTGKASRLI